MKLNEVPQDHLTYYGDKRRALYAVDARGHYTTAASSGWEAETAFTGDAAAEYTRMAQEARIRVEQGWSAPLEFHMYDSRMDIPLLAEAAGIWKWRLRRHLRAHIFRKLRPKWPARYAAVLGLSVEDLCRLPPARSLSAPKDA